MSVDPTTTKYLVDAEITAEGVIEKADVVGAIFGQTEGLLGDDLDLRDLQKSGRMGRIEVVINSKKGKSEGKITLPSSLDQVETAILASALETIDRVGPCKAQIKVNKVEDVRASKKKKIIERATMILSDILAESRASGVNLIESVRQSVQQEEIVLYGTEKLPAGPNIESSDAIIVVEGRSDVINLLKHGVKNVIAVEGTNVPETIKTLTQKKTVTAFVDGDRGGKLILKELLQVADLDFIATAPPSTEVEELTQKQVTKSLRNKVPADQYVEMYGLQVEGATDQKANGDNGKKGKKDRNDRKDKKRDRNDKPDRAPEAPRREPPKPVDVDDESKTLWSGIFKEIFRSNKAKVLDKEGVIVHECLVKDLPDNLKDVKDGQTILLDGVISQRLVDAAHGANVVRIIGIRTGNVTKLPDSMTLLAKSDLE